MWFWLLALTSTASAVTLASANEACVTSVMWLMATAAAMATLVPASLSIAALEGAAWVAFGRRCMPISGELPAGLVLEGALPPAVGSGSSFDLDALAIAPATVKA